MAVYKIFPSKDATMYSYNSSRNTGLDEILELSIDPEPTSGFYLDIPRLSRFIIQFGDDEINKVYNYVDGNTHKAFLRCYAAEVNSLPGPIDLAITTTFDDYGSWNMGTGKFNYDPEYQNGVSWTYMTSQDGTSWPLTNGYNYEVSTNYVSGGGAWFTNSDYKYTQTLDYYTSKDINVEVTDAVDAWNDGVIGNNGFIVRIDEDIYYSDGNNAPVLKYYSRDTHTIYPPCLEIRWNDYDFNVNSNIDELNTLPAVISIDNNPGVFYPSSINQFRVNSRPEYPARAFQTSSYYTQNYYLPENSCYAIKDLDTNEYIVDFDEQFTKLSVDDNGSYFTLYMNGLEPERYYSILIKTVINGSTIVFDSDYNFKVING